MLRRRCRLEAGKAQPKHERHTDQEHKLRCGQLVRCRGRSARHRAAWCRGSGNHDGLILGRPGGSWAATCCWAPARHRAAGCSASYGFRSSCLSVRLSAV
jgi:hypothetical protein